MEFKDTNVLKTAGKIHRKFIFIFYNLIVAALFADILLVYYFSPYRIWGLNGRAVIYVNLVSSCDN